MDILQWFPPLSLEKGLLRSKMAPYLFDGQGEQGETRSQQRDADSLDATQDFFGVGLEAPWRSSMSTCPSLTKQSHVDQHEIVDKVNDTAFGLELKCLMPLILPGGEDPEPDDPRQPTMALYTNIDDLEATRQQAYKAIADTIRQAGHSAATISEIAHANLQERDFWDSHWIVKRANSAEPTPSQKALKGYIWVPTELCSPKLGANNETERYYTQVEDVIDVLRAKHRLASNYTCDIHVHIGRMDDGPFQLSTLKRLGMLLWMVEPVLRTIRDPKSPNYDNLYTWGAELRRFSRLALEVTTEGSKNGHHPPGGSNGTTHEPLLNLPRITTPANPVDIQALQMISDSPTHRSLGILLSGETKQYRRLGFNFSAFGEEDARARSNPRTVEFRIMEGTVRSDLVLAWLRVCKAVVEVAVDRDGDRFTRVLGKLLSEADKGGSGSRDGRDEKGSRAGRKFDALMRDLGLSGSLYQVVLDKVVRENK